MFDNPLNEPLYWAPRSFSKVAARNQRLSENPSEWGQQILNALYTDQPQLNDRDVDITWESKDDKTGNAVGRLTVDGKIAIPIFVEDRRLAPMDTFVMKGRPYRMSPRRLKEALFDASLFKGPINPMEERALMPDMPINRATQNSALEEGRNIMSSFIPVAFQARFEKIARFLHLDVTLAEPMHSSIMDRILPTISLADQKKLAEAINSDPQIAANFMETGHHTKVARILAATPRTLRKVAEDLTGRLPANVVQFRYHPDGSVTMKMASDAAFHPQEVVLSPEKFASVVKSLGVSDTGEALRKSASSIGLTITNRDRDCTPLLVSDMQEAEQISKFGFYVVKDLHGDEHKGWVFPQVITFGKEAMHRQLFVGETIQVLQDKIAGVRLDEVGETEYVSDIPKTGQYGAFIFEGSGNALATEPFKVTSVERQEKTGELLIMGQQGQGVGVLFHLSKRATDIVPIDEARFAGRAYLLPATAKFASLKGYREGHLMASSAQLTKAAAADLSGPNAVTIRSFAQGRAFLLAGEPAEKTGSAGRDISPAEASFLLAAMGLSGSDAAKVLEKAAAEGEVVVGGLRAIVPAEDVLGHEKSAKILQQLASLPVLKQDTLKIASEIKDPEILDRVLALNFLNPSNIGILVDHMDDLESTGSRLSEMLIAARMGAKKDLPEDALVQSRQALDDVLGGLANLKSRLGPQTNQAEMGGESAA